MKKTLKIPKDLCRSGMMTEETVNEKKVKRISISSDTPYLRYDWMAGEDYYEVLSHDAADIDETRLKLGLTMLFNHRRDDHLGRATNFTNNGHRIDVGTMDEVIWSESDFAKTKRKDVENGSLVGTSVGYSILDDGECIGAKDGIPIYKFKWAPHEFSFCTIEADTSVGAGRQRDNESNSELREITVEVENTIDPETNKDQTTKHPSTPTMKISRSQKFLEAEGGGAGGGGESGVNVVQEREDAVKQYRKRYNDVCAKMDGWISALKNEAWKEKAIVIAAKHKKNDEPDYGAFLDEARNELDGCVRLEAEQKNPNVGLDMRDIRRFSMAKAILELSDPRGNGLTGHEKAVCEFAATQYFKKDGRVFQGAAIPSDITEARADEMLDLNSRGMDNLAFEMRRLNQTLGRTLNASTFSAGGFLVGVELLAGSFIDILRNACFIGQGAFGIIELNGLIGNIAIPKQTSTAVVYWLPEAGTVTASEFAGGQLYLVPHRLACLTQFTKQLLLQSTPSVEMLVRNDQAQAIGVEEDRVVYAGSGVGGEPLGITNTSGVGANVTFSGNWQQPDSLAFEYNLENANVRNIGQMVFVTSPLTKSYAKGTVQVTSSTFPIYIWMGSKGEFPTISGVGAGVVNEYPAYATKQLSDRVLFGIFNNNVIKARWGGFDLLVDPFTGAASETIKSYINEWIDVGIRYPQAFEYSTDAPTAP